VRQQPAEEAEAPPSRGTGPRPRPKRAASRRPASSPRRCSPHTLEAGCAAGTPEAGERREPKARRRVPAASSPARPRCADRRVAHAATDGGA
jgi:hypothetical protein